MKYFVGSSARPSPIEPWMSLWCAPKGVIQTMALLLSAFKLP